MFNFWLKFLLHKHVYLFYVVFPQSSITDIRLDVPKLNGDNYKIWNERILLQLGCMDIDYAIRKDEPVLLEPALQPNWLFKNAGSDLIVSVSCL